MNRNYQIARRLCWLRQMRGRPSWHLDELDQALQDFNASKEGPRQATTERMAQTESLSQLIREANEILRERIDRMVNLFRPSHPDFVAGYRGLA